jgi:hypothetical protein
MINFPIGILQNFEPLTSVFISLYFYLFGYRLHLNSLQLYKWRFIVFVSWPIVGFRSCLSKREQSDALYFVGDFLCINCARFLYLPWLGDTWKLLTFPISWKMFLVILSCWRVKIFLPRKYRWYICHLCCFTGAECNESEKCSVFKILIYFGV